MCEAVTFLTPSERTNQMTAIQMEEFWFCDALGEAWDLELHDDQTPCDVALRRYGVGGVTDDKEHARCGYRQLVPVDAFVLEKPTDGWPTWVGHILDDLDDFASQVGEPG